MGFGLESFEFHDLEGLFFWYIREEILGFSSELQGLLSVFSAISLWKINCIFFFFLFFGEERESESSRILHYEVPLVLLR